MGEEEGAGRWGRNRGFNSKKRMQDKTLGVRSEEEEVGRRVRSRAGREVLIAKRKCRIQSWE